jgi:PmbA protein
VTESPLELANRVLKHAAHEEAQVYVHSERSGFARFADSRVHQPTSVDEVTVEVRVLRGGNAGKASTNRTTDEGLADVVARAVAAAAGPQLWPHGLSLPALGEYAPAVQPDPATAAVSSGDLADFAHEVIAGGTPELRLFGYVTTAITSFAVATSSGIRAAEELSDAAVVAIAAGEGASGYAGATSHRIAEINFSAVAAEAVERGLRTRGAEALVAGTYPAVLSPYAVGVLLQEFARIAFGGREVVEGTSFLVGRFGESTFNRALTIIDDATDVRGFRRTFDAEGVPKQRVIIVEEGVPKSVVWDSATAGRTGDGTLSTGHAARSEFGDPGPRSYNLIVSPGTADVDELLAAADGGIYVTRVHYLSVVNARDGVITGTTRDGTFRIRRGRLAEPLCNLRFTISVPEIVRALVALGSAPQLVGVDHYYEPRYPTAPLVPALATAEFRVIGTGSTPGL